LEGGKTLPLAIGVVTRYCCEAFFEFFFLACHRVIGPAQPLLELLGLAVVHAVHLGERRLPHRCLAHHQELQCHASPPML
jgi:hypothetical protein